MRYSLPFSALLVAAIGCFTAVGFACDTPVFRYAMYKWEPAPYEVYCFYERELSEQGQAVADRVEQLANQLGENANIVFTPVDITEYEESKGKGLPIDVRRAFEAKEEKAYPLFGVFSPIGHAVHWGELSVEDINGLAQSPVRKKLAEKLAQGDCCVYLVLEGKSEAKVATKEAGETLTKMFADLKAGKIELLSPPPKNDNVEGEPTKDESTPTASFITVSRDDPAEAWFVKTLLGVESDLYTFNEPMVFPVFGRGRALPPFIGQGIRRDLLIEAMEFATGACSCTVKDQNPGVDLLVTADWVAASEKLAEKYGAEEGNEGLFADVDFLPEILVPNRDEGDNEVIEASLPGDATSISNKSEEPPTPAETNTQAPPSDLSSDEPNGETVNNRQLAMAGGDEHSTVEHAANSHEPAAFEGDASATGLLAVIGAGLGVGLLALVAATFFMKRSA